MLYKTLIAALPFFMPLWVQAENLSPLVRRAAIEQGKFIIEFDVQNPAQKPVHSWLMALNLKGKDAAGNPLLSSIVGTSEACARGDAHVAPLGSRRCSISVPLPDPEMTGPEADIQILATMYADGTAEGDLQFLDSVIQERRMRLMSLRYWDDRFHETLKSRPAVAQLRTFAAMLFGPDPLMPAEIQYDSTAMREQKLLQGQITAILEALQSSPSDAENSISRLTHMLDQRIQEAEEQCKAFPASDKPYALSVEITLPPVENLTSGFRVLRAEQERDGTFRLVMRNFYEKEIVEYALRQRQPDGVMLISRNLRSAPPGQAIVPGTAAEIRCEPLSDSDPPIEISCVIFRDGTSDGDQEVVRSLNESWAGRLTEMKRVLPRLRTVFDMTESDLPNGIEGLVADLAAWDQAELAIDDSVHFALGVRQQRQAFTRELEAILRQPAASRTELGNLIRRVEARLGRN